MSLSEQTQANIRIYANEKAGKARFFQKVDFFALV